MLQPNPGTIWGASRRRQARHWPQDVDGHDERGRPVVGTDSKPWLHFGHSDMSALPIVDEAVYWAHEAAAEALKALNR
eukprot:SAG22_NODE_4539_length_1240_cov_1.273444_2_plen_78_part_00